MIRQSLSRIFQIKVKLCLMKGRIYRKGESCRCFAKDLELEINESHCSRYYLYNLLTQDMKEAINDRDDD